MTGWAKNLALRRGAERRRMSADVVELKALGARTTEGAPVVVPLLEDRALLWPGQLLPHIQLLHEVLERLEGNCR